MAKDIHPTAVIDPKAELADGVRVGPYTVIGPHVKIGEGALIHNHVTVTGHTTLGARVQVHPNAVVGGPPQDLKYKGEPTTLEVGEDSVIRECCTLNPGTELGGGRTVVGHHCLLMAYVHIAHDCRLGNNIVIANCAQLAGHVEVQDGARISGLAAIHHFVTVGRCGFVAGCARLSIDVPPYTMAQGHPARIIGLNREALKRRGTPEDGVVALKEAFRLLYRNEGGSREEAYRAIAEQGLEKFPTVADFVGFVRQTDKGRHGRRQEGTRTEVPPDERDGPLAVRERWGEIEE